MWTLRNARGQWLNIGNVWGSYDACGTLLFTFHVEARDYAARNGLTDVRTEQMS